MVGASGVILSQTGAGATPGGGAPAGWVPVVHLGTDGKLRSSLFWHNDTNARLVSPGATTYNDGQWHHVAFTRNSTTGVVQIFVDGVLQTTGTSETGLKTTPFRLIGAQVDIATDGTTVEGNTFFWEDVVLDAIQRGRWNSLEQEAREGFAALDEVESSGREEELDTAAELAGQEFRYARDLVTAKEMEHEASIHLEDEGIQEDARLIRSQVERCRLILERMGAQGADPFQQGDRLGGPSRLDQADRDVVEEPRQAGLHVAT